VPAVPGDGFQHDVGRLKELLPRLEVRVIEGADRVSILERPELLTAIRAFFEES
jgi:hypothetical protein